MNRLCIMIATTLAFTSHALAQVTRQVSLTITCHAPGPVPLQDVPFAGRTLVGPWYATTNAAGRATASVSVQAGEKSLRIRMGPKEVAEGEEPDMAGYLRATTVKREHFVPEELFIGLDPAVSEYALNVSLTPIRAVTLHVVDENGVGQDCIVRGPGDAQEKRPVTNGVAHVRRVPTSAAVLVVLRGSQLVEVVVPPGDADVDLGKVEVPALVSNASVSIHLTNAGQVDTRGGEMVQFPVLVSADGMRLLQLWSENDRTTDGPNSVSPARIPAGEYWVSPFPWSNSGTTQALIRLVRSGVDLSLTAIPKIAVQAGTQADLELDAATAQRAILKSAFEHGVWPEY